MTTLEKRKSMREPKLRTGADGKRQTLADREQDLLGHGHNMLVKTDTNGHWPRNRTAMTGQLTHALENNVSKMTKRLTRAWWKLADQKQNNKN